VRSLPPALADEFPVKMTTFSDARDGHALSKVLYSLVKGCSRAGVSMKDLSDVIREVWRGIGDEDELDDPTSRPTTSSGVSSSSGYASAYYNAWQSNMGFSTGTSPAPERPRRKTSTNLGPPLTFPPRPSLAASTMSSVSSQTSPTGLSYASPTTPGGTPGSELSSHLSYFSHSQPPPLPESNGGTPSHLKRPYGSTDLVTVTSSASYGGTTLAGDTSHILGEAPAAKKRVRHCCKCGGVECKGKGGYQFCTNVCRDCGQESCRGRNSKKPERNCKEGWI